MSTITTHAHGTFCWPELATRDSGAAKRFYGSLFGWEFRDNDMGPNGFYTIFTLGDREVAAGYTQMLQQHAEGVPPHWGAYVAVDDADEAATTAEGLGGKLLQPAFDVMDFGRMAVIADPQGAAFSVWQARSTWARECWANRVLWVGRSSMPRLPSARSRSTRGSSSGNFATTRCRGPASTRRGCGPTE